MLSEDQIRNPLANPIDFNEIWTTTACKIINMHEL